MALNGTYRVTDTLSFQSNLYYRGFRQHAIDGNTSDIDSCDRTVARRTLCLGDGTTILFDTSGNPISSRLIGGAVAGTVDRTSVFSDGIGGAFQLTATGALFGHPNHLSAGLSYDGATFFPRETRRGGQIGCSPERFSMISEA